ncbi:MAG: hypothetical protein IT524_09165 [Nitrosomonas sp.]|nr:hypothetical protein [Nitrosomonas sp.]
MKLIQTLAFLSIFLLFQNNVSGTSIAYDGLECLNATNANDITPNATSLVQSRFEVIENSGEGIYRLTLTGGIPRVIDTSNNICIDSVTAIGYSGIPAIDGLPRRLDSIDATGYFNGRDLLIVISSMVTDLSAKNVPFLPFSTSQIFAITHTLIFEFDPQAQLFNLIKIIRNQGLTHTSESTNLIFPFLETVLPSFNDAARDKPKILTPPAPIQYRLE